MIDTTETKWHASIDIFTVPCGRHGAVVRLIDPAKETEQPSVRVDAFHDCADNLAACTQTEAIAVYQFSYKPSELLDRDKWAGTNDKLRLAKKYAKKVFARLGWSG